MAGGDAVRIDKFLWVVRLFKTRALAAEAIKKGHITIGNMSVKTSRTVKTGDTFEVRNPPIVRSYKILEITEKRMGAKLVPDHLEETTSAEQLEQLA